MMNLELELKERALDENEKNHGDLLSCARSLAEEFAQHHEGLCSVEDVRMLASQRGLCINFSRNWVGALFRDRTVWEYFDMVPAAHKGGHARRVMRWRLKGNRNPIEKIDFSGPRQLFLMA